MTVYNLHTCPIGVVHRRTFLRENFTLITWQGTTQLLPQVLWKICLGTCFETLEIVEILVLNGKLDFTELIRIVNIHLATVMAFNTEILPSITQ